MPLVILDAAGGHDGRGCPRIARAHAVQPSRPANPPVRSSCSRLPHAASRAWGARPTASVRSASRHPSRRGPSSAARPDTDARGLRVLQRADRRARAVARRSERTSARLWPAPPCSRSRRGYSASPNHPDVRAPRADRGILGVVRGVRESERSRRSRRSFDARRLGSSWASRRTPYLSATRDTLISWDPQFEHLRAIWLHHFLRPRLTAGRAQLSPHSQARSPRLGEPRRGARAHGSAGARLSAARCSASARSQCRASRSRVRATPEYALGAWSPARSLRVGFAGPVARAPLPTSSPEGHRPVTSSGASTSCALHCCSPRRRRSPSTSSARFAAATVLDRAAFSDRNALGGVIASGASSGR
jgi:hypothetical protein